MAWGVERNKGVWTPQVPDVCGALLLIQTLWASAQWLSFAWRVPICSGLVLLLMTLTYSSCSQPSDLHPWRCQNDPFTGVTKGHLKTYRFTLHFIKAKLWLWSSNENNFVVGGQHTLGTVFKGCSIKVESHCLRSTPKVFLESRKH